MTKKQVQKSRRPAVVFFSLAGVLTGTTALLLALSPRPLTPGATLLNAQTAGLGVVFDTPTPPSPQRWNAIYVRHTATTSGNAWTDADPAAGPGDHFVIGNGDGAADGEIQIGTRWMQQAPAFAPPGSSGLDPHCICVSLVGDFSRSLPTEAQNRRLIELVTALQARLSIPAARVYTRPDVITAAGTGTFFPQNAFRSRLLP